MPLESQLVNVNFAGGIDEKTSDRHVVQGKLRSLVNGRFRKVGEISKRYGTALVATQNESNTITSSARIGSFEDAPVLLDTMTDGRPAFSSYSSKTGQFELMGTVSEAVMTQEDAHFDSSSVWQQDFAWGNGVYVYVWSDVVAGTSGNIWYMVRDASTGTMVVKPSQVAATTMRKPRVVFVNSSVAVLTYQNGANIVAHTMDASTLAWSAGTNIITNNTNYGDYDMSAELGGAGSSFAIAYQKTGGGQDLAVKTFNSSLTLLLSNVSTYTPAVGPSTKRPIACDYSAADLWVFFVDVDAGGPTYKPVVTWFNSTTLVEGAGAYVFASLTGDFAKQGTIVRQTISGSEYGCFAFESVDNASNAGNTNVYSGLINRTGTTLTLATNFTSRMIAGCSLASRAFVVNHNVYFYGMVGGFFANSALFGGSVQAPAYSMVLIDPRHGYLSVSTADNARPVAIGAPRSALWDKVAMNSTFAKGPCSVVTTGAGDYRTLGRIKVGVGSSTANGYRGPHGLSVFNSTFGHASRWQQANHGELSCFSGGANMFFDGRTCGEIGFAHYPEDVTTSNAAGGGSMPGATDYTYRACYVFYDERGNVHRSAPSPISAVFNTGANSKVDVNVCSLHLTSKNSSSTSFLPVVGVEYYRSLAGATGGPHYLVNQTPTAIVQGSKLTTFTDSYADADISIGPRLYTSGGIIDNVCPPSFLSMVTHRGRLGGIDGKRFWFTKQLVNGEGPAFADEFTLEFDLDDDLTAVGSLDDKWVVFAKNAVYIITGRGPDDTANGNDYEITRLTTDRGCIEPRSVVSCPLGLFFQSSVGIYLLTRGLEVQYIGAEVQDTLASYPTITSAKMHPTDPTIYFTCVNNTSDAGVRIVYDYDQAQWITDHVYGNSDSVGGTSVTSPALSATVVGSSYYWQDAGSYVFKEDPTTYLDFSSQWVTMSMGLAPINLQGINGYQRVRYVYVGAKVDGNATITLSVDCDNAGVPATYSFAPALTDMRVDIARQLCRTLTLDISDAQGATVGTGQGFSLVQVGFEVGVYPRSNRLAAANRL